MSPTLHVLDWCGCSLGLVGAYTLAFRLRISRYGWVSFFIANIAYVFMAGRLGLLAQQVGFMGSSAIGIYRHFFVRALDEPDGRADQAQAWAMRTPEQILPKAIPWPTRCSSRSRGQKIRRSPSSATAAVSSPGCTRATPAPRS